MRLTKHKRYAGACLATAFYMASSVSFAQEASGDQGDLSLDEVQISTGVAESAAKVSGFKNAARFLGRVNKLTATSNLVKNIVTLKAENAIASIVSYVPSGRATAIGAKVGYTLTPGSGWTKLGGAVVGASAGAFGVIKVIEEPVAKGVRGLIRTPSDDGFKPQMAEKRPHLRSTEEDYSSESEFQGPANALENVDKFANEAPAGFENPPAGEHEQSMIDELCQEKHPEIGLLEPAERKKICEEEFRPAVDLCKGHLSAHAYSFELINMTRAHAVELFDEETVVEFELEFDRANKRDFEQCIREAG